MAYLVLARKYRPQNFEEVIGQEHISDLLSKAITSGRIAHAYLFCGPRGIGKTSCARILAKCLNCQKGPTTAPCGECSSCKEITKSTSFDVIEIDGASNRGIDEIRTLRENVKFAPSYGRYKIYIIDEVHMLTTEAFNALLKTLEEPPEHVKFIFATTAPNKVPSTIISRCQRFDFKRITVQTVMDALSAIAGKEKLKIKDDALFAVAKAAQGSLRDALSILDQLSSLSEQNINAEDVYSMLGLVETEYLFQLTDAIGKKNCTSALEILDVIINKGKDVRQLVRDLTEHYRNLMVIKIGGKTLSKLVDYPGNVKEQLFTQTQLFSLREIILAIDILIEVQESSKVTESFAMPLEIALAKLTFKDQPGGENRQAPAAVQPKPAEAVRTAAVKPAAVSAPPANILKNQKGELNISNDSSKQQVGLAKNEPVTEIEPDDPEPFETNISESEVKGTVTIEHIQRAWDSLTFAVSRQKMSVATYLQDGRPSRFIDSKLFIIFPQTHSFQKETLEDSHNLKIVQDIFSEKLNTPISVKYELAQEESASRDEEPKIKNVLDTFKGKVVSRWHNE